MMKTNEERTVREMPEHQPVLPEELHELPEGIVVPDDLSGLQLEQPVASTRRTRAVRWLPWLAAGAVLAGGAVIATAVLLDESTEPAAEYTTAQVAVQQSIDEALAAQGNQLDTTAQVMIQQSIDEALAAQGNQLDTTAQQLVQAEIDAALAAQTPGLYTTAQQLVQAEIDAALAEFDR